MTNDDEISAGEKGQNMLIYFCASRKPKCAFTGFCVTISMSEDRECLARANNTSTCLVYSGCVRVSAPAQHNSAPDEQRHVRRAVSPGHGSVGQSYWLRPGKTNISLRHVLCGFFPAHAIQKPVSGPTCT